MNLYSATEGITADQTRTSFGQEVAETAATADQLARDIITEHTRPPTKPTPRPPELCRL